MQIQTQIQQKDREAFYTTAFNVCLWEATRAKEIVAHGERYAHLHVSTIHGWYKERLQRFSSEKTVSRYLDLAFELGLLAFWTLPRGKISEEYNVPDHAEEYEKSVLHQMKEFILMEEVDLFYSW